jgi:predicted membrane protein (TIGR00267 family)
VTSSGQLIRIGTFFRDELTEMVFYEKLSERVSDPRLKSALTELSSMEKKHSEFWKTFLEAHGVPTEKMKPHRYIIFAMLLFHKVLGTGLTVKILEHGEVETVARYRDYALETENDAKFKANIESIIEDEIKHEDIFSYSLEENERFVRRNRDIVYGISDGLVEVLAALAGLTALITNHYHVALGGLVVGISGTISMSVGAYLSANTESKYRISILRRKAILENKKGDDGEIKSLNQGSTKSARNVGFFYILGATVPIVPYLFLSSYSALVVSVILVTFAQGFSNAIVALTMNMRIVKEAVRASLLGLLGAVASFSVAYAFHIFLHISFL